MKELKVELFGEVSITECITYLDNGDIFIHSRVGESQLIKLIDKADKNGSYCDPMEIFTNLAPIADMAVVDLDKNKVK